MTGKKPGDSCPGCKEGRLLVRTKSHSDSPPDPMHVVIGQRYMHWTTVTHLVCNECSGMYESANRGTNVQNILEAQIATFQNPSEEPIVCTRCGGALVDGSKSSTMHVTRFRSCEGCLTVAWIFPTKSVFFEDDVLGSFRGPSPPQPHSPSRRRRKG